MNVNYDRIYQKWRPKPVPADAAKPEPQAIVLVIWRKGSVGILKMHVTFFLRQFIKINL